MCVFAFTCSRGGEELTDAASDKGPLTQASADLPPLASLLNGSGSTGAAPSTLPAAPHSDATDQKSQIDVPDSPLKDVSGQRADIQNTSLSLMR